MAQYNCGRALQNKLMHIKGMGGVSDYTAYPSGNSR